MLNEVSPGKTILITGAPNLGKSLHVSLLHQYLLSQGFNSAYVKYPVYELEPTGPLLHKALQLAVPLHDDPAENNKELQRTTAQNRRDFEPIVRAQLASGTHIIFEDYTITGLVWGEVSGVDRSLLHQLNEGLLEVDIGIVIMGERIAKSVSTGHKFESLQDNSWERACRLYEEYAQLLGYEIIQMEYGEEYIDSNQQKIRDHVSRKLGLANEV